MRVRAGEILMGTLLDSAVIREIYILAYFIPIVPPWGWVVQGAFSGIDGIHPSPISLSYPFLIERTQFVFIGFLVKLLGRSFEALIWVVFHSGKQMSKHFSTWSTHFGEN